MPFNKYLSAAAICTVIFFSCSASLLIAQAGSNMINDHRFTKHILTNDFISEGVAVADINRDGNLDIIAGAYWFEAPTWIKHEITQPQHYDPATQFSNSFLNFAMDVNMDGWVDQIRISLPGEEAVWYQNPGKKTGHWTMHTILANCGNESPAFVDVDGDGRSDILCNDPVAKEMIWMKSPESAADTVWKRYFISKGETGTNRYTHGLGFADMNGDQRKDIIISKGWWECPENMLQSNWIFHPVNLSEDCSQLYAVDANADGQMDLISASAHDFGVWWHERTGVASWTNHTIFDKFSESHGMAMEDVNNDGHPDLVTGKRYFAHNGKDPGALDPSVLYWFEFKPGKTPVWIPHLVDDNSGVGLQVLVIDINKDQRADIIVANKKGVFFFEQNKLK